MTTNASDKIYQRFLSFYIDIRVKRPHSTPLYGCSILFGLSRKLYAQREKGATHYPHHIFFFTLKPTGVNPNVFSGSIYVYDDKLKQCDYKITLENIILFYHIKKPNENLTVQIANKKLLKNMKYNKLNVLLPWFEMDTVLSLEGAIKI